MKTKLILVVNFLFSLRVNEIPNKTFILDSHQSFICSAGQEERRAGGIKIFILKGKTYLNIEQLEVLKMRGGGERGGRWRHNYVHV
jgi:hypothetical protein